MGDPFACEQSTRIPSGPPGTGHWKTHLDVQQSDGNHFQNRVYGVNDGMFHAIELSGVYPGFETLLPFEFWYRVEFSAFDEELELPSPIS